MALALLESRFDLLVLFSYIWRFQLSLRRIVGRLFNHEEYTFDRIQRLGFSLITNNPTDQALNRLPKLVCKTLEVEQCALWVWDEHKKVNVLQANSGNKPINVSLPTELKIAAEAPIELWQDNVIDSALNVALTANGLVLLVPLLFDDQTIGVLGVGPRHDEQRFDRRDIEFLKFVGFIASLHLLVVRQIEALRDVPARISEGQESERLKIAQELHDGPQQFLGGLSLNLASAKMLLGDAAPPQAITLLSDQLVALKDAAIA